MTQYFAIGLVLLGLAGAVGVQTWRLDAEKAEHKLTQRDLAAAVSKAEGWQKTAEYRQTQTAAQAALGQACLEREAAWDADASRWDAVVRGNPPIQLQTSEKQPGETECAGANAEPAGKTIIVSHEVRNALIDDLAVPLD